MFLRRLLTEKKKSKVFDSFKMLKDGRESVSDDLRHPLWLVIKIIELVVVDRRCTIMDFIEQILILFGSFKVIKKKILCGLRYIVSRVVSNILNLFQKLRRAQVAPEILSQRNSFLKRMMMKLVWYRNSNN